MTKPAFVMRVEEIFHLPDKTVFVGTIESQKDFLGPAACTLLVEGEERARLRVEGETLFTPRQRALWSRQSIALRREEWTGKVVLLRSDE